MVLARQWRGTRGELDLVLAGSGRGGRATIVFCEVKARASSRFGGPAAAVGPAKQEAVRRTALEWLAAERPRYGAIRFDVVCVVGEQLTVLEAAF